MARTEQTTRTVNISSTVISGTITISDEHIALYHAQTLSLAEDDGEDAISSNFYHIGLLHKLSKTNPEVVFENPEIEQMLIKFAIYFLDDDFSDWIEDNKDFRNPISESIRDEHLPLYFQSWLNQPEKNAYGGNGAYDCYILTGNMLRALLLGSRR